MDKLLEKKIDQTGRKKKFQVVVTRQGLAFLELNGTNGADGRGFIVSKKRD